MSSIATPAQRRDALTVALLTLRRAARGRPQERTRLLDAAARANLGLADALATRYRHDGVEADDLRQVAREGLLLALIRYDPRGGRPFAAFAIPTILGVLRHHFRDEAWAIRPPRRLVGPGARGRLDSHATAGRSHPLAARPTVALETCFRPDRLPEHAELGVPDDATDDLIDHLALLELMGRLSHAEHALLRWRYFEGLTQREIAERIGVSQVEVSRRLRRLTITLHAALLDECGERTGGPTPSSAHPAPSGRR